MTQHEKIKNIFKGTHENEYEKPVEADLLFVLVNIAESLAIIADHFTEQDNADD